MVLPVRALVAYFAYDLFSNVGRVFQPFEDLDDIITEHNLFIHYVGQLYGLKVKSFVSVYECRKALRQTARYGQQLGLAEI